METIITQNISYAQTISRESAWTRFINWCKDQQEARLLWLGIALAGHGCVLTPITVMIVLFGGLNFPLFMLAMVAMGMALVTNLAAMPTKVTIPVLFLSILIDIGIVIASVAMNF
jgi:hypothetical protein